MRLSPSGVTSSKEMPSSPSGAIERAATSSAGREAPHAGQR
jgi:hypothetical protein